MLSLDDLKDEEDLLRKEISELSPEQRKQYYTYEEKEVKDPDTYAVLNYFFLAGLHHFYLGKNLFGLLNLLGMAIGIFFIGSFGWVIFVAIVVIELPQLFRSQAIVQKYNNDTIKSILDELNEPY